MLEGLRLRDGLEIAHPEGTEQFFLFDVASGARYELNEVSYEMLRWMDGCHDAQGICAEICKEFEGVGDVRADLDELVSALVAEGLVLCGR